MLPSGRDEGTTPEINEIAWADYCVASLEKAQPILETENLKETVELVRLIKEAQVLNYSYDEDISEHYYTVTAGDRKFEVNILVEDEQVINSALDIEIWEVDPITGEYETTKDYMKVRLTFDERLDIDHMYVKYSGDTEYEHEYNK